MLMWEVPSLYLEKWNSHSLSPKTKECQKKSLQTSIAKFPLVYYNYFIILWTKLVVVMEFQLSYFKSWKMMLWKCCTQYASKFGKLSSGHRTGKGQFSFRSQRKAMPKNAQSESESEVAQWCSTLSDPLWTAAHQVPHPWDFPGKSAGVGCHDPVDAGNLISGSSAFSKTSSNI